MHCNLMPPDAALVVLGFHYEVHYIMHPHTSSTAYSAVMHPHRISAKSIDSTHFPGPFFEEVIMVDPVFPEMGYNGTTPNFESRQISPALPERILDFTYIAPFLNADKLRCTMGQKSRKFRTFQVTFPEKNAQARCRLLKYFYFQPFGTTHLKA